MFCGITNIIYKEHDDLDFVCKKSMLPDDSRIGAKETTPPNVSLNLGLAPHV